MLRALFKFVDALAPGVVERLLAHAFSRPRARSKSSNAQADPLRLLCSANRHPSGCALWAAGSGPTVLLVHGWEADHRDLDGFARPLLAGGYRVLAIDLPAHGVTGGRSATIPRLSDAISQVLENPPGSRVHAIVAHSLGGAAALRAVASSNRSVPLALLASPSRAADYLQRMIAGFGLAAERIDPILAHYERLHGIDLRTIDASLDAPRMREKVLLIYGEADRLVPPSEGDRYEELLSCSDLHILPGLGHRAVLHDDEVRRLVLDFVGSGAVKRRPQAPRRADCP